MSEQEFIPEQLLDLPEKGAISWQAPSNIALVKYWGKKENQIPANASVSFTLSNCHTETRLEFEKKKNKGFSFDVYFEGRQNEAFKPKIQDFFKRIEKYLPFLNQYHFKIYTENSFPHSSGIASSASGMSALALCLMDLEKLGKAGISNAYFAKKASFLARLGSGSASRSIQGPIVEWGSHIDIVESSDLFGINYPYQVHKIFQNFQDTILLVDKGQKQVSSSLGHNLMHAHPFAEARFQQADSNLDKLKPIFESGNLKAFIEIVESEALSLHAMMMSSTPYFILMKPNTLEIIKKIWEYRNASSVPVCFTLDAGANVHVLYPKDYSKKVMKFIKNELVGYCEKGHYICDEVGMGAKKLNAD